MKTRKQDELKLWDAFKEDAKTQEDGVIDAFACAEKLNIPKNRASYILEKWYRYELIECGVSIWWPWLTEKGKTIQSLATKVRK